MNIRDVMEIVSAEVLTGGEIEKDVTGCYVCDLLSLAMSKVNQGDVWITVQANVNIAAVVALTDAACVLIAENMAIDKSVIDKAESEGVIILRTGKSAFEAAMEIGKLL